jgi:hypothetical protein
MTAYFLYRKIFEVFTLINDGEKRQTSKNFLEGGSGEVKFEKV